MNTHVHMYIYIYKHISNNIGLLKAQFNNKQ